jgi:hypothetical protein
MRAAGHGFDYYAAKFSTEDRPGSISFFIFILNPKWIDRVGNLEDAEGSIMFVKQESHAGGVRCGLSGGSNLQRRIAGHDLYSTVPERFFLFDKTSVKFENV